MTVELVKNTAKKLAPGFYQALWDGKENVLDRFRYPVEDTINAGGVSYRMRIGNSHEDGVTRGRFFEKAVIETMLDAIKEGDVIANVGAATGTHAIPWAIKAGGGEVVAFEPDEKLFKTLQYNIGLNGLKNVIPLRIGLWESDGTLELATGGLTNEAPQIVIGKQTRGKKLPKIVKVAGRRLDSLVKEGIIKVPTLMNIDVEGAGREVLTGMGEIRPRMIIMELHQTMGEEPEEITAMMVNIGYKQTPLGTRDLQEHVVFTLR